MIYAIAFIGFIFGFLVGQGILLALLRHKSRDDIMQNKKLHWVYGTMNWIIAFFIAYVAVQIAQPYLTS
tara:strand:+ start:11511 stop:11717 length:207 start_codon:yes stop_codon:yes gene_type:complete